MPFFAQPVSSGWLAITLCVKRGQKNLGSLFRAYMVGSMCLSSKESSIGSDVSMIPRCVCVVSTIQILVHSEQNGQYMIMMIED